MTVTQSFRPGTPSARTRLPDATSHTQRGNHMTTTVRDTLNVIQALMASCQHPGIRDVEPYGPGVGGIEGVKVRFEWDAGYLWAYLVGNDLNPEGRPIDRKPTPKPFLAGVPWAPVPDPKSATGSRDKWLAADYVLKLAHDLCDAARPDQFRSWTPVGLQGVGLGHGPAGLLITAADGTRQVVRVTIGSGPFRDPEDDPWSGYTIPAEGISTWIERLQDIRKAPATPSSAATAGSVSVS